MRAAPPWDSTPRRLIASAAVVAAYVAAAAIGFRLAFVAEQVTTVWAPTGIAVAALLLGGIRLWPAVWMGALVANAGSSAPLWTAFVIATGNTLEAVAAVWWLRRRHGFDITFRRTADALAFVLIAAACCTAISATVGAATLCLAGVQAWPRFPVLWFDWWLGDALGALVVAPAILTVAGQAWSSRDALRSALWIGTSVLVTHAVFGQVVAVSPPPLAYVVFPVSIAAAVAAGPAQTSWVVLGTAVMAIWHTVHGVGPFASTQVHYSLILLQSFLGVFAVTSLLLAGAIAERSGIQQRERDAAANLRRREEMLRESRDVLTLAMRGGSMGAWSRDLATNEVWWSRELEEIFGLGPGEFTRTEHGFFDFVHADDRPALRAAVDEAVRDGTDYVVEFRFRHASGEWRWMEGRGRAVYADDRTPRTMYGIGVDITGRKRGEIALREAKASAESANRLKDQFLATLSHELRTPLNAILGYARLLQTEAIAPEQRQRALEVIARNAVAQTRLVEELLDMSRITSGKVRFDPLPVPVSAVLGEAVEGIKLAADARGIALDVTVDPSAGTVLADIARLQQVFWNVLTNAVKFTADGGRITVSLRRLDDRIEVVVADTGEGISPEFLPFVFEPFRQAENRINRAHGGLGLGLAISRQLVELHQGSIRVESPGSGRGTTITICLPRLSVGDTADGGQAAAPSAPMVPVAASSLRGVNILLVDDEPDTLTMFRETLEEAGASVRAVPNGFDALREAESWQPDLLMTDIGLPGMDGYDLLRAIRSKGPAFAYPAVAVSAYARSEDRARALSSGFQAHLAKPVDPAALVVTIRDVLSSAS